MRIKLHFIFAFLLSFYGFAQDTTDIEEVILEAYIETVEDYAKEESDYPKTFEETDNLLTQKQFEEGFQDKYQGADYDYELFKAKISLWAKFKEFLNKILDKIFNGFDFSMSDDTFKLIVRIIAGIIIAGVLYFLIRFLLKKEGNFFFSKSKKQFSNLDRNLEENIHEINFDESISHFESTQEYRNAIRYQFLFVLKKLADKKHIQWNPEKTNKDYYTELEEEALKTSFKKLAYIFDNVWYGEHPIEQSSYKNFKYAFLNIKI